MSLTTITNIICRLEHVITILEILQEYYFALIRPSILGGTKIPVQANNIFLT